MAEFLRLGNRDHLAHALLGQSKRGVSLALWLSLAHRDRFYNQVRGATSFLLVACSQVLTRGGVHSFGVETSDRRCLHFKSTLCASRAIEAGSRGTCPSHMVPFGRGDPVPLPPALKPSLAHRGRFYNQVRDDISFLLVTCSSSPHEGWKPFFRGGDSRPKVSSLQEHSVCCLGP